MRKTNYLVGGLAFLAFAGCKPEETSQPKISLPTKTAPVQTTQKVEEIITYESISRKLFDYREAGYISRSEYSDLSNSLEAIKGFEDSESRKVLTSMDNCLNILKNSDETQRKISGKSREEWNSEKSKLDKEFEDYMRNGM